MQRNDSNKLAIFQKTIFTFSLFFLPTICLAHPGHEGHDSIFSFGSGLFHPLSGFDHLLAMIAVGLWAVQRGGRAVFLIPLSFVFLMILGSILGREGICLPYKENAILASILTLGALIAFAVRFPTLISVIIVGIFAIFHGQVHIAEIPKNVSAFQYISGFVLTTISLHILGISLAIYSKKFSEKNFVRSAGVLIASWGFYLAVI